MSLFGDGLAQINFTYRPAPLAVAESKRSGEKVWQRLRKGSSWLQGANVPTACMSYSWRNGHGWKTM